MGRRVFFNPSLAVPSSRACETLARSFHVERLRLTMAAGTLIMEGQVPCYRLKKLAGAAAARLLGALGVVNRLRVVPQSHRHDGELLAALQAALRARPGLAVADIAVSARDGLVTLRGSVSSPAVRCEAESAAWAVGGVVDVENQLRVARLPVSGGWASAHSSLPAAHR